MLNIISTHKAFDGKVGFFSHASKLNACTMRFSVFVPKEAETQAVPVLYWLSGLTCTEENFTIKANAQRFASQFGIMLVAPDTSPRGEDIPGKGESWDLGQGAGFYVNATQSPWSKNYQMYDYVTQELPELIETNFKVIPDCKSIFGHSMGGHGALVIGIRESERYRSVSAFAPITHPCSVPWGEKAFTAYLGEDRKAWEAYDATLLVKKLGYDRPILVDQGTEDQFLKTSLRPENLEKACAEANVKLELRYQKGYDHSYYFISTFIQDHIRFHSKFLL
ncbi:MAG: S-formylglutathione hydrolase [Deltaproteobacteria bacterium]|nr:S-formylglutathione hydrolase [Deltaproteobacteria bacterium]MBM4315845.1 S-formylglutathione hydrolase [Deltaproteobacteria bacterium]